MTTHFIQKIKHLEHHALWGFMFLFIFDYHFWEKNWVEAILWTSVEVAIYMLIFYCNYRLIIPSFFKKSKYLLYLLSSIVAFLTYLFLLKISGIEHTLYEGGFWRNLFSMSLNFSLFWLISTLFWYYKNLQAERELQLKTKAEKLEAEMKFLKNQISPHFIFNTLNNIYSLVQQGHPNAAPMLAKLSTILRYILYDSSKEKVLLKKELETIQQYMALQLLRKPKSENIDFYQEGNIQLVQITPLILLNFVENCFKHSNIETSEGAWIKVSCMVQDNQKLLFTAENSKDMKVKVTEKSGLGNQNIQRQLALKYPNAHELIIAEEKDIFSVHLALNLKD